MKPTKIHCSVKLHRHRTRSFQFMGNFFSKSAKQFSSPSNLISSTVHRYTYS